MLILVINLNSSLIGSYD